MDSVSLDELLRLSRLGDAEAYAKVVRIFQGTVSGVAYSLLGDFHQSEDVAQETFLLAWKKLAELTDSTKFPAWLCSIARNLARNAARKKSNSFLKNALPILENNAENTKNADQIEENEQIEFQKRQSEFLWNTIEKIPEKFREPLILYYRNERSVREIAAVLGISEEAAKKRLARARTYLKNEVERSFAETLLANCPGEAFTLAVAAALPPLVLGTTANSVLAASSSLGVGSKTGAGTGIGVGKAGTAGTSLTLLEGTGILASSFFISMMMLMPGLIYLWSIIRNAPTLRTRRYTLVVGSLAVWWSTLCVALGTLLFALGGFFQENFLLAEHFSKTVENRNHTSVLLTAISVSISLSVCAFGFVLARSLGEKRRISWKELFNEDTQNIETEPLEQSEWSFAALVKCMKRIVASLFLISAVCTGILYFLSPQPLVPGVAAAVLFSFSAIYAWFIRDSFTMMRSDSDLQKQPPLLSSAYKVREKKIKYYNAYLGYYDSSTELTAELRTHYRLMVYNVLLVSVFAFLVCLQFFFSIYGSFFDIFCTTLFLGIFFWMSTISMLEWIDLFPRLRKAILWSIFSCIAVMSIAIFLSYPISAEKIFLSNIIIVFIWITWIPHWTYTLIKSRRLSLLKKEADAKGEPLAFPAPQPQPAIFLDPLLEYLFEKGNQFLQFVFTHGSDRFPSPRQTARIVLPITGVLLAGYVLMITLVMLLC